MEDASKHLESNVSTLKKMIHGLNRLDDSVREETFITQQVSYMSMIIVLSLKSTYLLKDMKMIDRQGFFFSTFYAKTKKYLKILS